VPDSRTKRSRKIRLPRERAQEGTKLRRGASDFRVHTRVARVHGSTPGDLVPQVPLVLMPRHLRFLRKKSHRQTAPRPLIGSPLLIRWGNDKTGRSDTHPPDTLLEGSTESKPNYVGLGCDLYEPDAPDGI
jgi:hypothetical protein